MGRSLNKRLRLSLTVTVPMVIALEDLAERSGLTPSAQATMLLRQGLDRTIQSDRVQTRLRQHNATRTVGDQQAEIMTEHAIEVQYAKEQGRRIEGLT